MFWSHKQGVVFSLKIIYDRKIQDLFWDVINDASSKLMVG